MSFYLSSILILNAVACSAGITYKIGDSFNLEAARSYYFSFIYSIISYGILIYGGNIMESGHCKNYKKFKTK